MKAASAQISTARNGLAAAARAMESKRREFTPGV